MNADSVLDIFKEITRIPRESGHEEPMTRYLQDWAAARSLSCKTDPTGNVLITKEAAPGKEGVPTLVLQAHQDMVCEKTASSSHDFLRDPIRYVIKDGWMVAEETTLGADDGIGVAACLALLDSDLPTGKVECLFTISEETGMDGAEALQKGFFTGKTLINLDSEDEGQLFIGCAGGVNTEITCRWRTAAVPEGKKAVRLFIGGAIGGHSGDDIDKGRVNAIQQMARFLYSVLDGDLQLISWTGGNKPNAIARECEAVVAVTDPDRLMVRFAEFSDFICDEYHVTDPGVFSESELSGVRRGALSVANTEKLVWAVFACPHGVYKMSQDIPGLVETSTNLASVKMEEGNTIKVVTSQRSSVKSALHAAAEKVEAALLLGGADVEHGGEYPGWKPNMDSHILSVSVNSYRKLFGVDPEVKAIHAGLECGLFLEKFPDLDLISFGPTLRGVHAPGERLELASLDKFVDLLTDIVTNFA